MTQRPNLAGLRIPLLIAGMLLSGAASAADPRLEPGQDPSGTPIAVVSNGFDYTRAEIARILARDGEGEAIAWDAVDEDHRPFAMNGEGTDIALAAAARGGVRIVPVRIAEGDRASLAKAIAFAANTPARILLAPLSDKVRSELEVLVAAAQKFTHVLFVSSLPTPTEDEKKKSSSVPNLVLLDARDGQFVAAENTARALGCGSGDLIGDRGPDNDNGAERKRVFLSRLETGTGLGATKPTTCETKAGSKNSKP